MPNLPIQCTLDGFEGPLDLLLHLIQREEIDIYGIPIARITEQYMAYMEQIDVLDLDMAGEFLVMAATLLEIKSRMLLPKPPPVEGEEEEGVDPRQELVERLLEYKRYKEAAQTLREWEELRKRMFTRSPTEAEAALSAPPPLAEADTSALVAALRRVLEAVGDSAPLTTVQRERVTVRMRMVEIWNKLRRRPEGMNFVELFEGQTEKIEIIVSFLAILELLRLRRITARQKNPWGDILIKPILEEDPGPKE